MSSELETFFERVCRNYGQGRRARRCGHTESRGASAESSWPPGSSSPPSTPSARRRYPGTSADGKVSAANSRPRLVQRVRGIECEQASAGRSFPSAIPRQFTPAMLRSVVGRTRASGPSAALLPSACCERAPLEVFPCRLRSHWNVALQHTGVGGAVVVRRRPRSWHPTPNSPRQEPCPARAT